MNASPPFTRDDALALAQTVRSARQQFAQAFLSAQPSGTRMELEAVRLHAIDDLPLFADAFAYAHQHGWLAALCEECIQARLVADEFLAAARQVSPNIAALHGIVDPGQGFASAGLLLARMPTATAQVCCIEIDGQPTGTGFLIRPHLVMTAYHVIRQVTPPLLDADNRRLPDSHQRLRVRFGYDRVLSSGGAVSLQDGKTCKVATDWLVFCSPCHTAQLIWSLPADPSDLDGFCDFAVIRLAELPGINRDGLAREETLNNNKRLFILQHPRGRALEFAQSVITDRLGDWMRFVHTVNTQGGSSGAPCFNDNFQVVGIHQGEFKKDAQGNVCSNIGVPMRLINKDLQLLPPADWNSHAELKPQLLVCHGDEPHHPVFGRRDMQRWVWNSLNDPNPVGKRILVVTGDKGVGKSFTLDIARAMLPPAAHLMIILRASEVAKEIAAVPFVEKHLLPSLNLGAGDFDWGDADTTDDAWLKHRVVPSLLAAMDRARNDRTVWLVLDELDEVTLPDSQTRLLLDNIYDRAGETPWLRILLLGFKGTLSEAARQATQSDRLFLSSETSVIDDLLDYLQRRLGKEFDQEERHTQASLLGALLSLCGDIGQEDYLRRVARIIIEFERRKFGARDG